jgi:hypothetical protein
MGNLRKPTISPEKAELHAAVKALAAKDRPVAVAILARYGVLTTPQIKPEDIPAVTAVFLEALKKFDGAP